MIKICLKEKNNRFFVMAKGHAGYKKEGEDIVCAAVSALILSGAEAAKNTGAKIHRFKAEKGFAVLSFSGSQRHRGIFDCMKAGLQSIAEQYFKELEIRN